jgi:hypothetical protein
MGNVAPYAKAVVGFLLAGLGAVWVALDDGQVTTQEWVGVAVAALATLGGVWAVPNAPRVPTSIRVVPPPQ